MARLRFCIRVSFCERRAFFYALFSGRRKLRSRCFLNVREVKIVCVMARHCVWKTLFEVLFMKEHWYGTA